MEKKKGYISGIKDEGYINKAVTFAMQYRGFNSIMSKHPTFYTEFDIFKQGRKFLNLICMYISIMVYGKH